MKAFKLIVINALVFVALLGGLELYFRIRHPSPDPATQNALWQNFHTYVMFLTGQGRYTAWTNRNTGRDYPADVQTNSLGFNDRHEFSYTKAYAKAPKERVVLFTSGSAGWGVGATTNEATVAGRLQHHLNALQHDLKYTVINLSAGSWIAYQQFIALELWGDAFQPDWVVTMDGYNDAQVGCGYSQGVGNPLYFATVKSYVDAYLFSTAKPVFFRGWFENQLIRFSAAYRGLTGKEFVRRVQHFDQTSQEDLSIRRQIIPTRVSETRDVLAFYLKAQKALMRLYPDAGYIVSTQPLLNQFTGDFVDMYAAPAGSEERRAAAVRRETELDAHLKNFEREWCSQKVMQPTFTYTFVNGAIRLERLVDAARAGGRKVEYINTGSLLPNERADRMPFFVDTVHLSDRGADVLGKFYAERILAAGGR